MNEKNTKALCKEFPALYGDLFHFECGDGWYQLLWDLSRKIEHRFQGSLSVEQVKQKFGGLRFYVWGEASDVAWIHLRLEVKEAETRAWVTCESCGKPGTRRSDKSWIEVLCDSCPS